jgi:hypothetical protein
MRAMDDGSGESAQPDAPPSAVMGTDLSNRPAINALVLGITSFVLLPTLALVLWAAFGEVQLDDRAVIVYFISLVAAIYASRFGVEGRRLAKAGAPGRVPATIGLVLGLGFIAVTVLGLIVGFIVFSINARNDSL